MPHDDAVRMRPHMPGTVYIVDGKRRYPHQRNFAVPCSACLQKPLPRDVQIGFGIIGKAGRIQDGICHNKKFKQDSDVSGHLKRRVEV